MAKDKENKGFSKNKQCISGTKYPEKYPFFKRFVTLPEASFYCGQAESSIKTAVYAGDLPVIQRGERSKWILDVYDLDKWMLAWKRFHKPVDERIRDKQGRFK
jgi:hypothetical protein